jgi:hypothetical protein
VKIYANAAGQIVGWWEHVPPEPNYVGVAETLEFDPETNEAPALGLKTSSSLFALAGGTLYREGQAVTVNPPSTAYTERQQALALVQTLKTFNGLNWAGLTTAQKSEALRQNGVASNRLMLILGRLLLREMSGE